MALKSIASRLAALSKVDDAFAAYEQSRETLINALAAFNDPARTETVQELIGDAKEWLSRLEAEAAPGGADDLPQVAEAITAYLDEHPDSGTHFIYEALRGRFRTDSANPDALLRITLSQMKRVGKVTMDNQKRYRNAPK